MKTKMTADWAGSVRLPILKQRSGSNPAHTQTHTQTDTHPLYPLKTPLQFTAKAVSAKKENLFFSPPHHNVKSIRLASLTKSQKKVWEGPSLLCGYLDAIPAEMMKRTPVEGAPLGQAWKGNCQRKGEKKGEEALLLSGDCVSEIPFTKFFVLARLHRWAMWHVVTAQPKRHQTGQLMRRKIHPNPAMTGDYSWVLLSQ